MNSNKIDNKEDKKMLKDFPQEYWKTRAPDKARNSDIVVYKPSEVFKGAEKLPGNRLRYLLPEDKSLIHVSSMMILYPPGESAGNSGYHWHEHSQQMLCYCFRGEGVNKGRLLIGWPSEKAKIIEFDEPVVVFVPNGVHHQISNIGSTDMILFEFMVPSWSETGSMDIIDSESGILVKNLEEYNALFDDEHTS